jgi:MFS family permease
MDTAASSPNPAASGPPYRVGTLTYTKASLVMLFVWMLWGDFCFVLMDQLLPMLLPLQLKALGASGFVMGLLTLTIPSAMNFVITPIVSFRSDRYRSKWGRRIPFLLFPTPFLVLFLGLMGYSKEIAAMLEAWDVGGSTGFKPATITLLLVGVLVVGFQFFNMFVSSVYYYLFNDVVPEKFIGRFMALFRVVASLASFVFLRYIFGWAEGHMKEAFIGVAVLYGVSFTLMCFWVKEGEYPPPPKNLDGRPGLVSSVKTYFRECYTHPLYLVLFLGYTFYNVANAARMFQVFFAKDIGMSVDAFGKVLGWGMLLQAVLLYPIGILVDRFHPVRVIILGQILMIPFWIAFCYFVHGSAAFSWLYLAWIPFQAMYLAANYPLIMALLPKERFGQFCSAQALVNAAGMICGTALVGKFMDLMGSDYRYLYMWMFTFHALSVFCMLAVYRFWIKLGGPKHYLPPQVGPNLIFHETPMGTSC